MLCRVVCYMIGGQKTPAAICSVGRLLGGHCGPPSPFFVPEVRSFRLNVEPLTVTPNVSEVNPSGLICSVRLPPKLWDSQKVDGFNVMRPNIHRNAETPTLSSAMSSSAKQPVFEPPSTHHRRLLFVLSCMASLLTLVLTVASAQLPLFDSSPKVLLPPWTEPTGFLAPLRRTLASAVLRWDAFHFAHIAREGYLYEHEWAFFPAAPSIMRSLGGLLRSWIPTVSNSPLEVEDVLVGGMLGSMLSVHSVLVLYDLTLELLGSPNVALLAALLSLLPSSPVTLRIAGYSEAIFTWCSYSGECRT